MSVNRIASTVANTNPDTSAPLPLQRVLSPPQPFPINALGDVLAPATQLIADVIRAPVGICGQSILAAVTLAVQGYVDIEIDGRIYPLSEFFLTIGATGERKSAVDSMVLRPHRAYQEALRLQYDINHSNWLSLTDAYISAKKEYLKNAKSYEEKKKLLSVLGSPPPMPLAPLILIEEPTYEGLIKLLSTGQPSIGLFSDEGGRFIGGHGMNVDNLLKTAAGLSELWDGKAVSRIRAGDSTPIQPGKRLALHLMAQPNVAQIMLSNSLLSEQGLMSRCLITWPVSTVGERYYQEVDLTTADEFLKYTACIANIFNTGLPLKMDKLNELSPRRISLSKEAKALYIAFHDEVECNNGDGRLFSSIRGFANKAPDHAVRLAGILAVFNNVHCSEIDVDAMASGIVLVTYYINEALRLHNSSAIDPDIAKAQKLLDWLQSQQREKFTTVEIYQRGPGEIREAQVAKKMMGILVTHNWAAQLDGGLEFNGIHRKEAWRLLK